MSLSQQLARRIALDLGPVLPADERQRLHAIVRHAFIDTAACILAGRDEPATARVLQWARGLAGGEGGPSSILFGSGTLPAPLAALVNGVAGHALDYDDVGLAGHPSVVLVPALLAEHERSGAAGFALVQAYARGYAVWHELQRRLQKSLHAHGWHPTAVFGTLAATAALASVRGLPPEQTADALGIAASRAAGVVANFGSMTKPLHIGFASQCGFHATELAALGLDASPDALDGPAGLLSALVGRAAVSEGLALDDAFDRCVLLQGPGIKKYPICFAAHRVVDGVLDLAEAHGLQLADVASAHATVSTTAAGVMRHHRPGSLTEARFSLEFAVAAALRHRRLGLREVSAATLQDPAVQAFLPSVQVETVDTSCPIEPSFAFTDDVTLTLRDGRRVGSGPIRFARGHAERPLREADLLAKLEGCLSPGEALTADAIVQRVDRALADRS